MPFPTSISMTLVGQFWSRELVSIEWDHVVMRDYFPNSYDAFDAVVVVKINGIEHKREVRIPHIRDGECRVDIVDRSAGTLEEYSTKNAKRFVMAMDSSVSDAEAGAIAHNHVYGSIQS
jgi:hypothetical protein